MESERKTTGGMKAREDMREHRMEVAALQEAMWNVDAVVKGDRGEEVIDFRTQAPGYRGLGFYMSRASRDRLVSTRVINERVAAMRFRVLHEEKGAADVAMINAYAPPILVKSMVSFKRLVKE